MALLYPTSMIRIPDVSIADEVKEFRDCERDASPFPFEPLRAVPEKLLLGAPEPIRAPDPQPVDLHFHIELNAADITNMMCEAIGAAFNIPPSLLRGMVDEKCAEANSRVRNLATVAALYDPQASSCAWCSPL
ncbi:hypothetical protein AB4Y36_38250 [Paraburkholderia sp. BR10936]|uniref:hypothetical protein n=1 Tax=Paraburkholderia sp. BR10936 TaxID=3236993 RepID=UPI0034D2567D